MMYEAVVQNSSRSRPSIFELGVQICCGCVCGVGVFDVHVTHIPIKKNEIIWTQMGTYMPYEMKEPAHEIMVLITQVTSKAQASLCMCAVSPDPSVFAQMKYGSSRRVNQKSNI